MLQKDNIDDIYQDIINSLTFLTAFLKESNLTFLDYFKEDEYLIPLSLKHIYARYYFSIFLCLFSAKYII